MENKKIGFFSRVKMAVANLENYSIFLEEKSSVAVRYFFLIVLILAIVLAFVQTYGIMKIVGKGYQYIENELPDFSYEDGNLTFSERIYAYDEEYDIYMIADTGAEVTNEDLQEYENKIKSIGIIFLKDRLIYKNGNMELEYPYREIANQYGVGAFEKETLLQKMESIGMPTIAVTMFGTITISSYLIQMVAIFLDWLIITIFAVIAARICRMNMTFRHCFNISIYALTLSIILSMLYQIAYTIAGFYTDYFRIVYLLIAYVYVVAVILMIKSDLLKQHMEVAKIVEVQKQVHKELENPEKEEEKKKENKKTNDEETKKQEGDTPDEEPDGSEI